MPVCGADSCLFVDKKMINEGGNFVYILYICTWKLRKECNLLEMSIG